MDYIEMKPLNKQESWTLLQCLDIQDRGFTFGDWLEDKKTKGYQLIEQLIKKAQGNSLLIEIICSLFKMSNQRENQIKILNKIEILNKNGLDKETIKNSSSSNGRIERDDHLSYKR